MGPLEVGWEVGKANGTYHRTSTDTGTPGTEHPALLFSNSSPHPHTLFSSEVSLQLINLQLRQLFLVTDPICWLFCVQHMSVSIAYLQGFVLVFGFCLFRAAPTAYGSSQNWGQIGAAASGLHHSHSNTGSEPHLQPTPQLTALLDL